MECIKVQLLAALLIITSITLLSHNTNSYNFIIILENGKSYSEKRTIIILIFKKFYRRKTFVLKLEMDSRRGT
jgi:ABC-type sugar transport system permease subunit